MGTVVLAKGTGAANSADFNVGDKPLHVLAYPVANMASEVGNLVEKNPDGTYQAVYNSGGTLVALGATWPSYTLTSGRTFRVEWAARTSAIGVVISEQIKR